MDKKDESPRRNLRLRSRRGEKAETESEGDQNAPGMSLDVLAHVASETLKNEPKPDKKLPRKKLSLRTIGSVDVLTLDQILGLTEKTILNLFTEVSSNEISRTFTFTCHLMPKQCQKTFSSFGSEMRARVEVKKHIYNHLNELEAEEANSKTKFTAEPLPARRKRLMNTYMPSKKTGTKRAKSSPQTSDNPKAKVVKKEPDEESVIREEPDDGTKRTSIGFVPVPDKLKYNSVSKDVLKKDQENEETNDTDSDEENEKRIEENEQFIIDLLSKTQPHHDHSYTTIFGRRKGADLVSQMIDDREKEPEKTVDGKKVVVVEGSKPAVPTPILFLRHRSPDENVPMVSAEEIIMDELEKEESSDTGEELNISSGQKPYPPMPKSVLAKRGRLGFDISDIPTDCSDDEYEFLRKRKKSVNPLGREGREGNLGWEPKLALRFIRELKGRKKDENIPLKCKICHDKTFTAAATLMYHYRSHAGIKPFVCLICNTTFTRQHSLNYHMLIHNNQSRFTCSDCGRKFRHPSHFKEHLRRHTGETPFECRDCGQRFKTRNTYKRHLKTRHGKLLTATGIHVLTFEEFAKVRTKRYNIPKLPDISYEMPELTFTKLIKNKDKSDEGSQTGEDDCDLSVSEIKRAVVRGLRKNSSYQKSGSYPKLPDIGYEMPELTFTKIAEQKKRRSQRETEMVDSSTETVLKALNEIKREVGSDDEEDPELDNILQVLSEASAIQSEKDEREAKEDKDSEELDIKQAYTTGVYVNKSFAGKSAVTLKHS